VHRQGGAAHKHGVAATGFMPGMGKIAAAPALAMGACSVGKITADRVLGLHAGCAASVIGGWAGDDGGAGAVGLKLGVVVVGGVFVLDFGDAADGIDAEVRFFGFFGYWGRWWRDVGSGFVEMGEVALAIYLPAAGPELFVITHDGHIARDGTDGDGDQEQDGEDALDDDDDDTDDCSRDALQVEAVVERCG